MEGGGEGGQFNEEKGRGVAKIGGGGNNTRRKRGGGAQSMRKQEGGGELK